LTSNSHNTGILIFAAGRPEEQQPGALWLQRYLNIYEKDDLFWWNIGSAPIRTNESWISRKNVIQDNVWFEINRLNRRCNWNILRSYMIKRLTRHKFYDKISAVLVIVDLFTWPYIVPLLNLMRKPVIGIILDDLIPMHRLLHPKRPPPCHQDYFNALRKMAVVLVVSKEMCEKYQKVGLNKVKLLSPLGLEDVRNPGNRKAGARLEIGVIGTIYGRGKLLEFFMFLNSVLAHRARSMRFHMTRNPQDEVISTIKKCKNLSVNFLGELHDDDIQLFAQGMDCLFMNAEFEADSEELVSTQFASKLPVYISLGRPILNVAPVYYPPTKFLQGKPFGICVTDVNIETVETALDTLLSRTDGSILINHQVYKEAAKGFDPHINRERLRDHIQAAMRDQYLN